MGSSSNTVQSQLLLKPTNLSSNIIRPVFSTHHFAESTSITVSSLLDMEKTTSLLRIHGDQLGELMDILRSQTLHQTFAVFSLNQFSHQRHHSTNEEVFGLKHLM